MKYPFEFFGPNAHADYYDENGSLRLAINRKGLKLYDEVGNILMEILENGMVVLTDSEKNRFAYYSQSDGALTVQEL